MTDDRSKDLAKQFSLWSAAGDIGLKLTLPLLIFMLAGIKLDRAAHSSPLFTLLGMGLALTTSAILIARMIIRINSKDN